MAVYLHLSSFLRKYVPNYDPTKGLVLENAEGRTIREIVKMLGIPEKEVTSILVNHMPAQFATAVKDGDKVAFVVALGGG